MPDEKQKEQVTVRPGEANNRLRDALNMSEFNSSLPKTPKLPPVTETKKYVEKIAISQGRASTVEAVLSMLRYFSTFDWWEPFASLALKHIREDDAANTVRVLAMFFDGLITVGLLGTGEKQRAIAAVLNATPDERASAIPAPPADETVLAVIPPNEEERGLTAEPHLSSLQPEVHVYTLPEKLSLAVNDVLGQKPEYSGRYCPLCNEMTSHFRPRGKGPDYVKSMQWCCAPCFMPGGAVYEIVKSLMIRQGEIAK